jgi:hypothetical protein
MENTSRKVLAQIEASSLKKAVKSSMKQSAV